MLGVLGRVAGRQYELLDVAEGAAGDVVVLDRDDDEWMGTDPAKCL